MFYKNQIRFSFTFWRVPSSVNSGWVGLYAVSFVPQAPQKDAASIPNADPDLILVDVFNLVCQFF